MKPSVLLIVAVSARALAVAARRAGYAAVAIDAFGDRDAREACREILVVEQAVAGFADVTLAPLVARLCAAHAPVGLVFGSGFDDGPEALAPLAAHLPILGAPDALARAKHPETFAAACAAAGVAHPEIAAAPPAEPGAWLLKRRGGSGGLHISAADRHARADEYGQRRVGGRAVSLLFVRESHSLTPIAWSEQWTAPSPKAPFRYAGAAGPISVAPPEGLIEKLAALTLALGVRGLASADFLDDGETFWLLEINPRPGATLDAFDDDDDPLLARHIAALVDGRAPPVKPRAPAAAEIVYAETELVAPPTHWPDWASDLPEAGTTIPAGAPVCTVTARAASAAQAKSLVRQRSRDIRSWLREGGRA